MKIGRGRLATKYLFFELLPVFIVGVLIFIATILLFQSFRLVERVVVYGADGASVLKVFGYLAISFVPMVLPMSLLFSVLMVYSRLSSDSEIVALRSFGLNMWHIASPAVVLGILAASLSAETSFYLAPWGNRQMEVLLTRLGQVRPTVAIREGVFSEGFFNLVFYANEVDSQAARLKKIFIFDERDSRSPVTIIAREGQMVREDSLKGQKAYLRLIDGNIHRTEPGSSLYTKVDFDTYDINLFQANEFKTRAKSPFSYNMAELRAALRRYDIDDKLKKSLEIEIQKRWAIAAACIIMAFLGVGLGTQANRRQARSNGFALSVVVIMAYWMIHAALETTAKNGVLPIMVATWATNVGFAAFALYTLRRAGT